MIVKICGLTDIREADFLKENNVDLAGMVMFYEKSKRNITVDKAKEIIASLHNAEEQACKLGDSFDDGLHKKYIKCVAVVVSPTMDQVRQIEEAGFDYIQIHGELNEEMIKLCKLPILKAFNVDDLPKYDYYLSFENIKGFVFDAGQPGSGKTFDWNIVKNLNRSDDKLYILAGGLNAENVSEAIKAVEPDGVDISSGVEYTDRLGKDPEKIRTFVENVRNAIL